MVGPGGEWSLFKDFLPGKGKTGSKSISSLIWNGWSRVGVSLWLGSTRVSGRLLFDVPPGNSVVFPSGLSLINLSINFGVSLDSTKSMSGSPEPMSVTSLNAGLSGSELFQVSITSPGFVGRLSSLSPIGVCCEFTWSWLSVILGSVCLTELGAGLTGTAALVRGFESSLGPSGSMSSFVPTLYPVPIGVLYTSFVALMSVPALGVVTQ